MAHNSYTHQVLLFVRDHPDGIRRREIADAFMGMLPLTGVDSILARLRNLDLVYNDGTIGAKGSTWYPKTHEGVSEPFPTIAAKLIEELNDVYYAGQELYLAKRLEELFGERT